VDPTKYIFCFNLRSYDRINKTPALKKVEEQSGVKYHELQRAQAEKVMPEQVHGAPGEGSEGDPSAIDRPGLQDQTASKTEEFNKRKEDVGLAGEGKDPEIESEDSIAKDAMLDEPKVSEEKWAGRGKSGQDEKEAEELREEERDNFIQEELYIHGKVCSTDNIADDAKC
jgi:phospholipase D1/2